MFCLPGVIMLSGCLLYFLVILAMHNVHTVLPPRVDTLTRLDRNSLIEHYFHLSFDYSEILGFLLLCHGIRISLRQLKRISVLMAYLGGEPTAAHVKL